MLQNTPYTKPLVLLAHQLYHLGDGVLQLLHVDGTAVDSLDKYLVVEGRLDFIRMLVLIDLLLQHLPFCGGGEQLDVLLGREL